MYLKLMYITNNPAIARIAENAGVDRIFLDMEYIGKAERQCGMDTVQSSHTIEDIVRVRNVIHKSQILVRCNSVYDGTKQEIDSIIGAGADIIMLPYFKTVEEAKRFIGYVDGRAVTNLLVETPDAAEHIDELLELDGLDEIHIGINDLSIGYSKHFLFEVLADGTVDRLAQKLREKGMPFGFGGIASLGRGLLSSEHVIMEHYRLGSSMAILSRSFCNTDRIKDIKAIETVFTVGVRAIREYEDYCRERTDLWEENRKDTVDIIRQIAERM